MKLKKVLIVEDDNDIQDILKMTLELDGVEDVRIASNGKEGLIALEEMNPDVVLCDVMMPEMDGFTMAKMLNSNPKLANTKLIYITGVKSEEEIARATNDFGAIGYIVKPFNTETLTAHILELLEKNTEGIEEEYKEEKELKIEEEKQYESEIREEQFDKEECIKIEESKKEEEIIEPIKEDIPIDTLSYFAEHLKDESQSQRYKLISELGKGGMGIVFLALDLVLNRYVAYKAIPLGFSNDIHGFKAFINEAKTVASLIHPNIVTLYDVGKAKDNYFIVMEYVKGKSLKDLIVGGKPLEPHVCIEIFKQVGTALSFAHKKKIIHLDVKPANIMCTIESGIFIAKLMDFGLAKVLKDHFAQQTVAQFTPFYVSPEQILNKEVDNRTDIYSFGVSMFEVATGKVPFPKKDCIYQHLLTPPPDPISLNEGIPPKLAQIILKCMEKEPINRFQSMDEVIDALEKVYE